MNTELLIYGPSGGGAFIPAAAEGIEWSTERRSVPGKLRFRVLNDDAAELREGAAVSLKADGKPVFLGYIFTLNRDKEQTVTVTAYDQLRYLNNKDTYVYENKTASQLIKMIAEDFSLRVGTIEDSGFVIASRVEDNTSLFDMAENALDLTFQSSGRMFVLYDDFGKLTLKSSASMYVGENGSYLLIDEETGENFNYTSSIDSGTYNKIKLSRDSEDNGRREVYIAKDSAHINEWGVLQYFGGISAGENGQAKAEELLKLYNRKTRRLKITNALGDIRVRAGSITAVKLNLGDVKVNSFMPVEKVTHTFKRDAHFMDLTLRGGEFIG